MFPLAAQLTRREGMSNRDWLDNDFYAVLGVKRDATELEIKKAYRALAMEHHPDANNGDPDAADRFKAISQAFHVLSRSPERLRYDRLRTLFPPGSRPPGGFRTSHARPYRPVPKPPVRGQDLEVRVVLSERGARKGVTVPVEVAERGKAPRTVIVKVPAGVKDMQTWRIPGRGGYGLNRGDPGDLLVTARVFSTQDLRADPDLEAERADRPGDPMTLRNIPKLARMVAHFLLHPGDVELNEALSRYNEASTADWAEEIIRTRKQSRR